MNQSQSGVARRRGISALLLVIAVGCGSAPTELRTGAGVQLFDVIWRLYEQEYVFFERHGIDWAALRRVYGDSVSNARSEREVAQVIGAMIGRLHDYHAQLTTPHGTFGAPSRDVPHHFEPAIVQANYFAQPIERSASGNIYYTRLRSGDGYIRLDSFRGTEWGRDIDSVLRSLADVPGIVVDIRDNSGGNEEIAQEIASRFYDQPRVYRLSQARIDTVSRALGPSVPMTLAPRAGVAFRGPVAVLTNRYNASAAEDFILMMRILPAVTVVGDTTWGVGSNPRAVTLPNGWRVTIPRTVQSTPEGFVYERVGLPPSLAVPWSPALVQAGRDPYVEAAVERLRASTR